MTDDRELDQRIERALHARAGDAPTSDDLPWSLASTARKRVHQRRTRRIGAAAALAVVATFGGIWTAIGGPESFNASQPESASGGAGTTNDHPAAQPDSSDNSGRRESAGWRWESYGGVELQVPAAWTYGVSNAPWCGGPNGRQPDGEVGRGAPQDLRGCASPIPAERRGQHVWFSRDEGTPQPVAGEQLGGGWVKDVHTAGGVTIEVQTRDPALRDRILGSIREVSVDQNRCPVTHPISTAQPVQPQQGLPWDAAVTGVSICGYLGDQHPGPGLTGSKRLAGPAAQRVLDAIRAAPSGGGPDDPDTDEPFLGGGTVLRFDTADGVREVYVRYASGQHNGFDNGTSERRLTRESLTFMTGPLRVTVGPPVTVTLMPRG
jgi:hypothetical protein